MKDLFARYGIGEVGVRVPGLLIHGKPAPYHVLNERSVRAGAGIVFVLGFFSFLQAVYLGEYMYISLLVPFLAFDFLMKVVVGTRFSPVSVLSDWIVSNQMPEYVGAVQKRFAWSIGLILSISMLILIFGFGIMGLPNLIICGLCLTFMFMESAFGVCVGCKMYGFLLARGIIPTPEYRPVCPGNVCAIE